jgi:hypothetical protein
LRPRQTIFDQSNTHKDNVDMTNPTLLRTVLDAFYSVFTLKQRLFALALHPLFSMRSQGALKAAQ